MLSEYGIVIPLGIHRLRPALPGLGEAAPLTPLSRAVFTDLSEQLGAVDQPGTQGEPRITVWFKTNAPGQRLAQVEGMGPWTATALVAAVANPQVFKHGRQVRAWRGLVPRQASTGGKTVLRGISTRGDCSLRSLLLHGARALIRSANHKEEERSRWVRQVRQRRGVNPATVALAKNNARRLGALRREPTADRQAA